MPGDEHGAAAIPVPHVDAPRLSANQQDMCLQLMLVGASPPMACASLKVSVTSFQRTVDEVSEFAGRVQQVLNGLSQNVAARMYRTAMEGNVTAQRHFLQLRPPPEWKCATVDSETEELDPDELAEEYRAAGLDVPAELEALARPSNGRVES